MSVLVADEVTVHRGGATILKAISLDVGTDDQVLLQGTSGAGKTTLFEILGLLDQSDDGRVIVDGVDATAASESRRARLRRDALGFVYQEFRLVGDLTARENARLPMEHAGDVDDPWLDDLFDRLGIADQADQYPATLSGGEKQRVAIARALANRPSVVLADEPTGQLDPDTADAVVDLMFDLVTEFGAGLVVVSHDRDLPDRFASVYQLVDGSLRAVSEEGDGSGGGTASPS